MDGTSMRETPQSPHPPWEGLLCGFARTEVAYHSLSRASVFSLCTSCPGPWLVRTLSPSNGNQRSPRIQPALTVPRKVPLCRCSHRARKGGYTPDSDQRRGAPPASQPPPCLVASPAGSTSKCNHFSPHPRPPAQSNQAHRCLPGPVESPPRLTTLIPRLYFPQNGHRAPVIAKSGYIPLCSEPSHGSHCTLGKTLDPPHSPQGPV